MLKEFNVYFDVRLSSRVFLFLEAPEEEDKWEQIRNFAQQLLESLPGKIQKAYFLGNPTGYSIRIPRDFSENAGRWYRENKGRICVVNPVVENMPKKSITDLLVLICFHRPFDIEDWIGSSLGKSIILINMSESPFGLPFQEIDHSLGVSGSLDELGNRVSVARVVMSHGVPLAYDITTEGSVEVEYDGQGFQLVVTPKGERIALHLKALSVETPILVIETEKGTRDGIEAIGEPSWFEPQWDSIGEERQILISMAKRQNYTCPQCGEQHEPDCICCPTGGTVFQRIPLNTGVIVQKDVFFALSTQWYAFAVRGESVVFTRDGYLYKYTDGVWHRKGKIKHMREVDDGIWVFYPTI